MLELYQMITGVVLSYNDEKVIERCIKSIRWCDEIIIIDDESTDGTIDIAKKLGAKVFTRPLRDDFSSQWNFGLSKAINDWVLFVDSDEVVSEELADEIKEVVSMPNAKCQMLNGFFLRRKDYFLGKGLTHGEMGNIKLLRLAKKDAGKWRQPVHEEWKIAGKMKTLGTPLLHYPHQNVAQFLEEINRYSSVYAQYLHSQGIKEPAWQIIGKPAFKFLLNYIWRLGFLDGTAGLVVALMMSFHSFLVRSKLWKLWNCR